MSHECHRYAVVCVNEVICHQPTDSYLSKIRAFLINVCAIVVFVILFRLKSVKLCLKDSAWVSHSLKKSLRFITI